jgi:hypothetical protein
MNNESRKDKSTIRIELTTTQQERVLEETGKQADAIELSMNELEERIAPRMFQDM